LLASPI